MGKLKEKQLNFFWRDRFRRTNNPISAVYHADKPDWYNYFFHKQKLKIFDSIISKINIKKTNKVLDIGCGYGFFSEKINKSVDEVFAIDIVDEIIKFNKKNASPGINYLTMSATSLKFEDNLFDLSFSLMSLQHLPHSLKLKAISEICRVTKNKGYILLIESIKPEEKSAHVFPLSFDSWIEAFEMNHAKLQLVYGAEYNYLLRFAGKFFSKIATKKSLVANSNATPLISFLKKILKDIILRFLIGISYLTEPLSRLIFRPSNAHRCAFLFKILK
jgi:ubiquinone/menaquinone biosynthesis C-methylase UbiE